MGVGSKAPILGLAALANQVIMLADNGNPPCLSQIFHNDPNRIRGDSYAQGEKEP